MHSQDTVSTYQSSRILPQYSPGACARPPLFPPPPRPANVTPKLLACAPRCKRRYDACSSAVCLKRLPRPRDLINWPFAQRALALTGKAYDPGAHRGRALVDPSHQHLHPYPCTSSLGRFLPGAQARGCSRNAAKKGKTIRARARAD